jgi:hypothetical protein
MARDEFQESMLQQVKESKCARKRQSEVAAFYFIIREAEKK